MLKRFCSERCLLTTVMQDKGEKHPDQEPLRTLKELVK